MKTYINHGLFKFDSGWFHFLLLLVWLIVGSGLRFTHLGAKPPWNDEFATLVFSLGNSFRTVPINEAIALDTLLMSLQPNPDAGISDVISNLMTESTHPPVYFGLTHLWMQMFPTVDGLASFWAARLLSAIFGVASIPAIFGLGLLAFRSKLVGQIAAAMMAVSPFGIYLAQEARHYTLVILLIIASLCCLVTAARTIQRSIVLPIWVSLIWVAVNFFGITIHYFFTLTLCAEALVLITLLVRQYRFNQVSFTHSSWRRIYAVTAGTLLSGLVWLPAWLNVPNNQVTQWIYDGNPLSNLLETIARFLAWVITMFALLPIEGINTPIIISCGVVLVIFGFWALLIFIAGLKFQMGRTLTRTEIQVLLGYLLAAIALLFTITYGFGADLTIAARYQFFYFPVVIVLLASTLAICWDAAYLKARIDLGWNIRQRTLLNFLKKKGKKAVLIILLMGLIGSITVISNFAYQKPDRPDLLVPIIQEVSQVPVLIATAHFTHEQIGEMMGLALEFKRSYRSLNSTAISQDPPLFLLAHLEPNSQTSIDVLQETIAQLPKPLDLWLVNFFPTSQPEVKNCLIDTQSRPKMNGYKHRLYHCL